MVAESRNYVVDDDVIKVNPKLPAIEPYEQDTLSLLEDIRNLLLRSVPYENQDIFSYQVRTLDTISDSHSFRAHAPVKNLYIPRMPREADIYIGEGSGQFITHLDTGEGLTLTYPIPFSAITVVTGTGSANEQYHVFLTSKKMDIDIIDSADAP